MFIDSQFTWDYDSQMTEKYFAEYTRIEYDSRVNKRLMQMQESKAVSSKALDASLVVTECSGTKSDEHITSSGSGTNITHVVDADIRPVNDQVSSDEVDSNTTPDLTNMSHRGGEIDQDAAQDQVKSPLLKAEFLKTNDMVEKEVYNELSNRFLQHEKHCISLEISMQQKEETQLQAKTTLICNLKNQIKSVKEASNEAKLKKEINVLETINIELESSVAKLLAENEKLNKENEHLKQTYKELYDSIKKTRIQMKDHNDSLIAKVNGKTVENVDLKAQIQEKEARKKTQERNRNSKSSVMPSVRLQNIANGSTPNPKRMSKTPRSLPTSKSSCVTITVVPKVGKFNFQTLARAKVTVSPPNGSKRMISRNPYECNQTLISAGLALQRQMAFADNTSCLAPQRKESSGPGPQLMTLRIINSGLVQNIPSPTPAVPPTKIDWDSLFQPMMSTSNLHHMLIIRFLKFLL
ncbi:hypothetical protein Tco_0407197 [Tanacetum coccineum]